MLLVLFSLCSGAFTATSRNWTSNWTAEEGEGEEEGIAVDTYIQTGDTLTTLESDSSQLPFSVTAHSVKAFDYLGPVLNTASSYPLYNSTLHSAPLQILSLDKALCGELLSGTITSRTFINATVLIYTESLETVCHFSWFYKNPAAVYWSLADAGCSAIIIVTENNVPGAGSHLGSASRR